MQPQQITIAQALQYVAQFLGAGQFTDAQKLLSQVLQQEPNNHEALNLLAWLANAQGNPAFSEQCLRRAMELQPNHPVYLHNLGALLNGRGLADEAIDLFNRAAALDPNYADPLVKLGLVAEARNDLPRAMELYRRAIALAPVHAEAYCNLGDVLVKTGALAESLDAYGRALSINPRLAEAHANRATALDKLGREDDAFADLVRAVQINPNMAPALAALAQMHARRKEFEQAIAMFRRAIAIDPSNSHFYGGLGIVQIRLGQYEQAVENCRKAIQLLPTFVDPYVNMGLALTDLGEHDQALKAYEKALELDPGCAGTHSNRALIHLRNADFERGLADYEHRWRLPEFEKMAQEYTAPRWSGESLDGKTLLIWHEQGFGDSIHFIRYARILARRGATVIAQVQPQLLSLFKSVEGISRLITRDDPIPQTDYHIPMLGLPGVMKTRSDTIPGEVPYIVPDPALVEQWRERVAPHTGFRIGITWSGNPLLRLNHERSILLSHYAPIGRVPGVQIFSLQVGVETEQLSKAPFPIVDLTSHIRDFSDTAAFLANLDLVIAVDTAVLHLAGAMARPTWALIQKWPDWRWQLDREDSPWYPTVRLFRQPKLRDWPSVFERIARELPTEMKSRS